MERVMFAIFFIIFAVVFGTSLFMVFKNMRNINKNTKLPRITTDAEVIAHRRINNPKGGTQYFLTFKFESGDEYEYSVPSDAYSYFVDGDRGKLTIRGTEYVSFRI